MLLFFLVIACHFPPILLYNTHFWLFDLTNVILITTIRLYKDLGIARLSDDINGLKLVRLRLLVSVLVVS